MKTTKNVLTFILIFWFTIQAGGFAKSQMKVNRLDKDYDFNRPNVFVFDQDIKKYYNSEQRTKNLGIIVDRSIHHENKSELPKVKKHDDDVGVKPKVVEIKKKEVETIPPDTLPETAPTNPPIFEHKILIKRSNPK